MKLLLFAASLRKDSFNKKLIKITENIVKELNATPTLIDYAEFKAPIYNYDDEASTGFPAEIKHFEKLLLESDGLIISSPEYNFATPGTLKNLIDWASRLNPVPFKNLPILLISASISVVGGIRGLWNTRIPLEGCGAFVHPSMYALATADKALDENGKLRDENLHKRLKQTISEYISFVSALKNLRPGVTKMKRTVLFFALLSFSSALFASSPDLARDFQNSNSCFILYNVNTKQIIQEYNPEECKERISPDSTFKVPLSLMAFDDNIITQKTIFKWDGQDKGMPQWNHDQTPQSWLKNSVVWVSQVITPQIGLRKIKVYLHEFHYGNQNFSGDPYQNNGLTHAWLESSLKISGDEQLDFLKNLVANTLPVSQEALENTEQNMYLKTLPHGYKLFGKTGAGKNAWFIGYLTKPNQTYIVVSHIPIAMGNGITDEKLTETVLTQTGLF